MALFKCYKHVASHSCVLTYSLDCPVTQLMLTEDQLSDFLLLENWIGLTCFTQLVTRNQEVSRSLRASLELLDLTEAESAALQDELSIRDAEEKRDLIETMTVTISDQGRLDAAIIKFLREESQLVSQDLD